MNAIHYRVAVGHYARALTAGSQRPPYAPVMLLLFMWCHAPDAYVNDAVVHVRHDELLGLLASQRALSNAIASLVRVGAVSRVRGAYKLHKPAMAELDEVARAQINVVPALIGGDLVSERARKLPAEREVIALSRRDALNKRKEQEALRKETLSRLDKQLSDVRDALAWLVGTTNKNKIRYAGRGASAVYVTVDWFASTGATWKEFGQLCRAAKVDTDPNKPTDMLYLFDPKHDGYREGLLDRVRAQVAAAKTEGGNT